MTFFAECLTTYVLTPDLPKLTSKDIEWGSKYMLELTQEFDLEDVGILVCLMNQKLYPGKYAWTFNLTLNDVIRSRSFLRLNKLLSMKLEELFPECFNNKLITSDEIKTIKSELDRCVQAFVYTLDNVSNFDKITKNIMPNKCINYPEVCHNHIKDYFSEFYTLINGRSFIPSTIRIPKVVFVLDDGVIYSFKRQELISRLCEENYINVVTGKELSEVARNKLLSGLSLEIRLTKVNNSEMEPSTSE